MHAPRPSPRKGVVTGLALVVLAAAALGPFRTHVARATPALVLVVPVTIAGFLGGRRAAMAIALVATAVYNVVFLPPLGSLAVSLPEDAVALLLFLVVALSSGALMGHESSRRQQAVARADDLAEMNARLAAAIAERDRFEAETRRLLVLEEVDRQRAALLRAVSHQLRTPLGSIRAITSDLQAGTNFDPTTRAELLEVMAGETERLDRIVANLLSLSRIEAGAFQPDRRPEALAEIVDACAARLARLFRACRLLVSVDGVPDVDVDFTQIDQVLTNLLENAARYSPPGGRVTVGASCDGGWVRIAVADEGPGVAAARRAEVFEPFHADKGGIGVGLAICKEIVQAHGGTIGVGDTVDTGVGATFWFTVPAAG